MENFQGTPINAAPAADGQGTVVAAPAGSPSPDSTQVVSVPAAAPDATQGTPQGTQPTGGAPDQHFQSLYNKTLAEKYAIEEQLRRTQQIQFEQLQRAQQTQVQPDVNPHDPNTDGVNWLRWENQKSAREAAEGARKATREEFQAVIQQAQEANWAAQHPGVPVEGVKAFNRANGIADWNLDAGWKLITYNQQFGQVANAQAQSALNQFRQPQVGAVPVRGAPGVGSPQTQFGSYDSLALDYQNSNGGAYNSWPKEVQQAFDLETAQRYQANRVGTRKG